MDAIGKDLGFFRYKRKLGGGFQYLFFFTPKIGEMIQFDVHIFFRWVGSTTN